MRNTGTANAGMHVRVVDAGDHHAPAEIDDLRPCGRQRPDLRGRADGGDAVAFDGQRFGKGRAASPVKTLPESRTIEGSALILMTAKTMEKRQIARDTRETRRIIRSSFLEGRILLRLDGSGDVDARARRAGTSPASAEARSVTASEATISAAGVWKSIVQPNDCLLIT